MRPQRSSRSLREACGPYARLELYPSTSPARRAIRAIAGMLGAVLIGVAAGGACGYLMYLVTL